LADQTYPVMEIFYTLQGEGAWAGHAAHFVRLAGCDVGCVWCDVKESWDATGYPKHTANEIIDKLERSSCKIVVITGGEPAMYDLTELTNTLHEKGFKVHIETSGAYALNGSFDWVCFSPKKFKKPVSNFGLSADELKIIVFNKSDFEWAESYRKEVKSGCKLFLQPEWDKRDTVRDSIVNYVKSNPDWQVSLQTHKYLQIP
jgi:7-carboxy-7-deazaguanine synthase